MLALVDADYKFFWVDVGANGASSDAAVFNRSRLEPALRRGTLGLPPPFPPDTLLSFPSGGAVMSLCGLGISLNECCLRVKNLRVNKGPAMHC